MTELPELDEDDCQDPEFTELFVDAVTDCLSDIQATGDLMRGIDSSCKGQPRLTGST